MRFLRKSTAVSVTVGPFLDKTDGVTPETALTVTSITCYRIVNVTATSITLSASGGNNDMVHLANGMYSLELTVSDTGTAGHLRLSFIYTAEALPVWEDFTVLDGPVYDALFTVGVYLAVDVNAVLGDAQSAADLKDFVDAGYDPATNKVEGVKLSDTLTTYTGNTVQTGDSFARLGAPVGASISADITAVRSDVNDVQDRVPAALVSGRIDASVGAMASSVITNAALAADSGLKPVRTGTAQAGAANSITLDASASAVDDFYNNQLVLITGGTGVGQARFISDYVGATKVASVANWVTNPNNTSTFALIPFDAIAGASAPTAAQVADAVWDEILSGHLAAGSAGESLDRVDVDVSTRLAPTTAGRTLDIATTGEAGLDFDNVKTATVATTLTNITVPVVTTLTGHTPQTGDSFTRIGAPAGASVSADIAAVKAETASIQADTNDIQTRIPAALVSGRIDAYVGAMASSVLTASAIAADAITDAKVASDVTIASVTGSVGSVVADVGITQVGADKVWSTTTRALTDKVGFALSSAGIQAVWDALTSALTTVGSVGKKLADWVLGSDSKAILSNNAHTGAVIPTVTTLTGHTPQTGDSFARLGVPVGASIAADIAALNDITVADILAGTVDGKSVSVILQYLLSMAAGKIVKSTDDYLYKAQNGTTTLYTNRISTSERTPV